ncbi:MAG: hypothetical protein ACI38U_00280 [Corynebacterium sp.]|uniref:hypothetical protein n=1 Tax=Corynebacterium sp. TaxID=1720 RepID=UPI003F01CFFB
MTAGNDRVGCPDLGGDTDTRRMHFELSVLGREVVAFIRTEAHNGAGIADLGQRHRLRFRTVMQIMTQNGVYPRPVCGIRCVTRFTRAQADELVRMSRDMQAAYPGLSLGEIATRWGIPGQQLVNWSGSAERRERLAEQDAETDRELLQ